MQKENLKGLVYYVNNESKSRLLISHAGKLHERLKLFSMQPKIGDFHKDFYIKQIEKLAYHRSYYKILGKHHVDEVRHKAFEYTPVGIITQYEYAKRFGFDLNGQIQNELFDDNPLLSREGCCLDCFIKKSI